MPLILIVWAWEVLLCESVESYQSSWLFWQTLCVATVNVSPSLHVECMYPKEWQMNLMVSFRVVVIGEYCHIWGIHTSVAAYPLDNLSSWLIATSCNHVPFGLDMFHDLICCIILLFAFVFCSISIWCRHWSAKTLVTAGEGVLQYP